MFCRECGADLGRGWSAASLCDNCKGDESACICEFPVWNDECPVHHSHNPYDIPF